MNSSAILEVLAVWYEAFAERNAERREQMLTRCLTPDAEIWGHSHVFAGYAAISEKIAGFHSNFPDCRLVLASGLFVFENIVRYGRAIVGPDGSVIARGDTVMEIANDGRIHRMVPLWQMDLPPLPDGWPEHLAAPTVPRARCGLTPRSTGPAAILPVHIKSVHSSDLVSLGPYPSGSLIL